MDNSAYKCSYVSKLGTLLSVFIRNRRANISHIIEFGYFSDNYTIINVWRWYSRYKNCFFLRQKFLHIVKGYYLGPDEPLFHVRMHRARNIQGSGSLFAPLTVSDRSGLQKSSLSPTREDR